MKQFLRLLLICFGLLILLGLNEKESGDSNADLLASSTQSFREFCVCIPASATSMEGGLLTTAVTRQLPEHCGQQTTQKEQILATGIHTRILSTRDRYLGYRPDIRKKTGQPLHFTVCKSDPLPA